MGNTKTAKLKAAAEKAKDDFLPNMTISTRDVLELIAALEAAEKRVVELEQSEYQLIKERDYAEAALADMYKAATEEAPELSNWFGYADAVDAVEGRIAELEKRVGAAGINLETGGEA